MAVLLCSLKTIVRDGGHWMHRVIGACRQVSNFTDYHDNNKYKTNTVILKCHLIAISVYMKTRCFTPTFCFDCEGTDACSTSFMSYSWKKRSAEYQFYSRWFDKIDNRTNYRHHQRNTNTLTSRFQCNRIISLHINIDYEISTVE